MAESACKKLTEEIKKNVCILCNSSTINEQLYGSMYQFENVIVHHYCVLLSSQMEQNGQDEDGILGFLVQDILKEKRRAKKLLCSYCQLPGATVFCSAAKCKVKFHVPCGVKNDCLNQFFGAFKSYCVKHRPEQKIPRQIIAEASSSDTMCTICFEEVTPKACPKTLWAPCCSKNTWFHRKCIQSLAISAGYFFKCPLCNDKEQFQKAMLNFGIYIPQQDASWETTPNAFQELHERHDTCDLPNCKCPKNRRFNAQGTIWELILCSICASQGIHIGCGKLKFTTADWECPECSKTIKKVSAAKRIGTEPSQSPNSSSEESQAVTPKPRVKRKLKSRKRKEKTGKKLSENISSENSNSALASSSNTIITPDETSSIIVIDSDSDDIIEIVDDCPSPRLHSSSIKIRSEDSKSNDDVEVISAPSRFTQRNLSFNDQPTAVIKFRSATGNDYCVSASTFRNTSKELNCASNSESLVGTNPNLLLSLKNISDFNRNSLHLDSACNSSNANYVNCAIETVLTSSTSSSQFIPTPPGQISNQQQIHFEAVVFQQRINSATRSSVPIQSVFTAIESEDDSRESEISIADLPLTNDEKLFSRYNHLGLKPLKVIIEPLQFIPIGRNKFLGFLPSSIRRRKMKISHENRDKKTSKLTTKKRNEAIKNVSNTSSLSLNQKRKLSFKSSTSERQKKLMKDLSITENKGDVSVIKCVTNELPSSEVSIKTNYEEKDKETSKNIFSPKSKTKRGKASDIKQVVTKDGSNSCKPSSSCSPLNSKTPQKMKAVSEGKEKFVKTFKTNRKSSSSVIGNISPKIPQKTLKSSTKKSVQKMLTFDNSSKFKTSNLGNSENKKQNQKLKLNFQADKLNSINNPLAVMSSESRETLKLLQTNAKNEVKPTNKTRESTKIDSSLNPIPSVTSSSNLSESNDNKKSEKVLDSLKRKADNHFSENTVTKKIKIEFDSPGPSNRNYKRLRKVDIFFFDSSSSNINQTPKGGDEGRSKTKDQLLFSSKTISSEEIATGKVDIPSEQKLFSSEDGINSKNAEPETMETRSKYDSLPKSVTSNKFKNQRNSTSTTAAKTKLEKVISGVKIGRPENKLKSGTNNQNVENTSSNKIRVKSDKVSEGSKLTSTKKILKSSLTASSPEKCESEKGTSIKNSINADEKSDVKLKSVGLQNQKSKFDEAVSKTKVSLLSDNSIQNKVSRRSSRSLSSSLKLSASKETAKRKHRMDTDEKLEATTKKKKNSENYPENITPKNEKCCRLKNNCKKSIKNKKKAVWSPPLESFFTILKRSADGVKRDESWKNVENQAILDSDDKLKPLIKSNCKLKKRPTSNASRSNKHESKENIMQNKYDNVSKGQQLKITDFSCFRSSSTALTSLQPSAAENVELFNYG